MDLKILYEDNDLMAIDKPAGLIVFPEGDISGEKTLIDHLLEKNPALKNVGEAPRHGIVHRLDKDTTGVLLVAKTPEALIFLQKQFSAHTFSSIGKSWDGSAQPAGGGGKNESALEKKVEKKYIALVCGNVKEDNGTIHTFIGRAKGDPRKQKAYPLEHGESKGLREAITEYKVLERFASYTLLEVQIKTGRKHQIRCHLAYLRNPIAGDKLYGFKDSPIPQGLERQFLHAGYLKIQLPTCADRPSGQMKEFNSDLPEDLSKILTGLTKI